MKFSRITLIIIALFATVANNFYAMNNDPMDIEQEEVYPEFADLDNETRILANEIIYQIRGVVQQIWDLEAKFDVVIVEEWDDLEEKVEDNREDLRNKRSELFELLKETIGRSLTDDERKTIDPATFWMEGHF